MTDADLARWEALCHGATPAPWHVSSRMLPGEEESRVWLKADDITTIAAMNGPCLLYDNALTDALLAAEARTALPLLIAEVRRLRAGRVIRRVERAPLAFVDDSDND